MTISTICLPGECHNMPELRETIERLERENRMLKSALRKIAYACIEFGEGEEQAVARAALEALA